MRKLEIKESTVDFRKLVRDIAIKNICIYRRSPFTVLENHLIMLFTDFGMDLIADLLDQGYLKLDDTLEKT